MQGFNQGQQTAYENNKTKSQQMRMMQKTSEN